MPAPVQGRRSGARNGAGHNFGLDLVRTAAILLVLYSHAMEWFIDGSPLGTIRATYLGALGVELFFVLSGFLIGGILLRTDDAGLTARGLGTFWARRWTRTLPAYYAVFALLCAWFGRWDWPGFAFVQNVYPFDRWPPLSPHTWSLVVEEWFYLLIPAMLLALRGVPHRVPLLCAALIVGCTTVHGLALRNVIHLAGDFNINPFLRLDAPAWGVLAAWCVRRRPPGPRASLVLLLAGLALTAWQVWAFVLLFDPARHAATGFAYWAQTYVNLRVTSTSLVLAMVVVGAGRSLRRPVPLLAPAAAASAGLAYALYLVHVPVMFLVRGASPELDRGWAGHAALTALVVGSALVLRLAVERPFLLLRERLVPDPTRPASANPGLS